MNILAPTKSWLSRNPPNTILPSDCTPQPIVETAAVWIAKGMITSPFPPKLPFRSPNESTNITYMSFDAPSKFPAATIPPSSVSATPRKNRAVVAPGSDMIIPFDPKPVSKVPEGVKRIRNPFTSGKVPPSPATTMLSFASTYRSFIS